MGRRTTATIFLFIFSGAMTIAFLSCAADSPALSMPGELHRVQDTSGTFVGVDGWEGFTFGMSPEDVGAVVEKRGIVAEEDEAHGMFPSANGGAHSCRTFHHFRYKMNGWFVSLDLSGYRLNEIHLAAPDRYTADHLEGLVKSLIEKNGKPSFEQPLVKDFHAPRAQWSAPNTSLTLTTWPDGPNYGVSITIEGKR